MEQDKKYLRSSTKVDGTAPKFDARSKSFSSYKGSKDYTLSEYIAYYVHGLEGLHPFDEEDLVKALQTRYRAHKNRQYAQTQDGQDETNWVAYELEVSPIAWFSFTDIGVFGYFPTTKELMCLDSTIQVTDIPDGKEEDALNLVEYLYPYYGYIYGTYENLHKEFQKLQDGF